MKVFFNQFLPDIIKSIRQRKRINQKICRQIICIMFIKYIYIYIYIYNNEGPGYDTKQSDGEASVMLELWGMRSTLSLPLLLGPLWSGIVASDRSQIELNCNHAKLHCMNGWHNRMFANVPGSIPGRIISKTKKKKKMVLDTALLNTQHYKIWIKGKVEQSREWSSAHPYTSVQ